MIRGAKVVHYGVIFDVIVETILECADSWGLVPQVNHSVAEVVQYYVKGTLMTLNHM